MTGTLVANLAADVKHGVSSDGGAGTYRGADLWDAVTAAQLKHGLTKNQDGASIAGTYQGDDVNDVLSAADLRDGIAILNRNVTVNGLLDLPAESDVKQTVTYDNATKTGTYAPTADYPDEADVRDGTTFNNGISEGVLDLPSEAEVLEGITFDNGTKIGLLSPTPTPISIRVPSSNIDVIVRIGEE